MSLFSVDAGIVMLSAAPIAHDHYSMLERQPGFADITSVEADRVLAGTTMRYLIYKDEKTDSGFILQYNTGENTVTGRDPRRIQLRRDHAQGLFLANGSVPKAADSLNGFLYAILGHKPYYSNLQPWICPPPPLLPLSISRSLSSAPFVGVEDPPASDPADSHESPPSPRSKRLKPNDDRVSRPESPNPAPVAMAMAVASAACLPQGM
jgi:hypothetical protein